MKKDRSEERHTYYLAHKEKELANQREYRRTHRKQVSALQLEYAKRHPEQTSERAKKYRQNHLEHLKAYIKEYKKSHPEADAIYRNKRRTQISQSGGSYTRTEWLTLCKKYGYRCLCCGEIKKLSADHIIPVSRGGTSNIDNIQPLCGSCNSKKMMKIIDYRLPWKLEWGLQK